MKLSTIKHGKPLRLLPGVFRCPNGGAERLRQPLSLASGPFSWPLGGFLSLSGFQQYIQLLQVERQAYQTPFTGRGHQSTQRELSKAQDFFDEANHQFHCALAESADGLADLLLKFVGHLDLQTSLFGRQLR